MNNRIAVVCAAGMGLGAMLTTGASARTTAGWQTFTVPTGGFSVQLPATWVDVSAATPAVVKKIESNPSLRPLVGALNGADPLKLLATDASNPSTYMDVGVAHVGATSSNAIAKSSAATIRKAFHVDGTVSIGEVSLQVGKATLMSATVTQSSHKLAIEEYFLFRDGDIYAIAFSTTAALKAHYAPTFERSVKSFRFLPAVDLSGAVVSAAQVGSGYKATMIPAGNQVIGQATLDLCGANYPSENLRTARLQDQYSRPNGVQASNEVVTYVDGGAQEALKEVEKVLAGCKKPISQGSGAKKVTTTTSRLADSRLPTGAVGVRIHVIAVSQGRPIQGNIIVIYQVSGNTLSGVYTYDDTGKTRAAATTLAVHVALESARKLKSYRLAS